MTLRLASPAKAGLELMAEIVVIGGGSSMEFGKPDYGVPKLAVNSHAWKRGVATDYVVAMDSPRHMPDGLLNDPAICKVMLSKFSPLLKDYPNVKLFEPEANFDRIQWQVPIPGSADGGYQLVSKTCTLLAAVRVAVFLGCKQMYFAGCDMEGEAYGLARRKMLEHGPRLSKEGIDFYSLDPGNKVEAFTYKLLPIKEAA